MSELDLTEVSAWAIIAAGAAYAMAAHHGRAAAAVCAALAAFAVKAVLLDLA